MRVIIIGATGHIGSYLVPRLVEAGHEVVAVSRQQQAPYRQDICWQSVQSVALDRDALEAEGTFGKSIAALEADVVIDLICFTPDSARQLVDAVAGRISHFLHCGTIWVYGSSKQQPTLETAPRRPLGDYGRGKAAIEKWLLEQAHDQGFPATVLHPGHIVGPGWTPLGPAGNFNPQLFDDIAAGLEILLPDSGLETLHHVHADDVAQAFVCAIDKPEKAMGENFNIVADKALSLTEYTRGLAASWGQEAQIRYLPLEQWREYVSEDDYAATLEHLTHSPSCNNRKAKDQLDFKPRYTALEAILESLRDRSA